MLFLISLGFWAGVIFHLDETGNMNPCPFMPQDMACQMSIVEHISGLQSLFLYIPQFSVIIGFVFTLFLLVSGNRNEENLIFPKQIVSTDLCFRLTKPFDKLLAALSDGILQPKLYA